VARIEPPELPLAEGLTRIPPRPDLREAVYQRLRRMVLEVAIRSPEPARVREADVARSLGVSRTPVREALTRLQQEGLVTRAPRRRLTVVPQSLDEYFAWLDIREVLEQWAARRAARRATEADLAAMRALFRDVTAEMLRERVREYAEISARFHALVARASGNPVLERLITQVCEHTQVLRFRTVERLRRTPRSHAEHLAIIDALAARDGRRAGWLMRQHLRAYRTAAAASLRSPTDA
jgi:DNA-binding GntR family transcriptional regulator